MTKIFCDVCQKEIWGGELSARKKFGRLDFKVGEVNFVIQQYDKDERHDICEDCVLEEVRKQ